VSVHPSEAFPYRSVAVLGEGVTASAVRRCLSRFNCPEVAAEHADIVVSSPGIPPEQYPDVDVEIISEIEFAYRLFQFMGHPPFLIGITGTNGKTTVTTLVGALLNCPVAGNIGTPLVDYVTKDKHVDVIAVELSSYQLEGCTSFRPNVAIMLTFTPDHLQRHKTMEAYGKQKQKLWAYQTESDVLIYNSDDDGVVALVQGAVAQTIPISVRESGRRHPYLRGLHNLLNIECALQAARCVCDDEALLAERLQTFQGVEHRLEFVGMYRGCLVFNDSKSTNPDSTRTAIQSFSEPVHLIFGGDDKGLEIIDFYHELSSQVSSLHTFGALGQKLNTIEHHPFHETLDQALAQAFNSANPGDVILFSPGSSSFDQFDNFEQRGDHFKEVVRRDYV